MIAIRIKLFVKRDGIVHYINTSVYLVHVCVYTAHEILARNTSEQKVVRKFFIAQTFLREIYDDTYFTIRTINSKNLIGEETFVRANMQTVIYFLDHPWVKK